jgi:hypothetical protein
MATVARDEDTLDPERVSAREMRVVFDAAFALMVVNFADRHIVVATFPQLQAEWGASDTQLHRLAERYGSGRVFLAGEAVYTVLLLHRVPGVRGRAGRPAARLHGGHRAVHRGAPRAQSAGVRAAELVPLAGAVVGLATDLISI